MSRCSEHQAWAKGSSSIKSTFPIIRRLKGDLLYGFSWLMTSGWLWRRDKLFSGAHSERAGGNSHILQQRIGHKEKTSPRAACSIGKGGHSLRRGWTK